MCQIPGVQVVANVPVAGPVPPPIIVVTPDISASSICCGQMKWIWVSMPPAVRIMPSPAITSVPAPIDDGDVRLDIGIARLADRADATVLDADVGLHDAGVVDDQRVGDDRVRDFGADALALTHAVADHLATAELHFFAIDGEVLLDLDPELGVGEPYAIADGRTEHFGVGAPGDLEGHGFNRPMTLALKPYTIRSPARAMSSIVRVWPGSKRTAVPAAMLSRRP